jgi:hypothetical protein
MSSTIAKKLPLPILPASTYLDKSTDKIDEENKDIEPSDLILLFEMINNIKKLPFKIKDIIIQIINELNNNKNLLDDKFVIYIDKYIDFLAKQNFANSSFACKECMYQENIYDILQQLPKITELENLGIDLVEEYRKYLEQDPDEINKIIINFMNSNMVDLLDLPRSERIDSKKTVKIEELTDELTGGGVKNIIEKFVRFLGFFNPSHIPSTISSDSKNFFENLEVARKETTLSKLASDITEDPYYLDKRLAIKPSGHISSVINSVLLGSTKYFILSFIEIYLIGENVVNRHKKSFNERKTIIFTILFSLFLPYIFVNFILSSTISTIVKDNTSSVLSENYQSYLNAIITSIIYTYIIAPLYTKILPSKITHKYALTIPINKLQILYPIINIGFSAGMYYGKYFLTDLMENAGNFLYKNSYAFFINQIQTIPPSSFAIYKKSKKMELHYELMKHKDILENLKVERSYPVCELLQELQN